MNRAIGIFLTGASVVMVLWVLSADHKRAMDRCLKTAAGYDTCFVALR